MRKDRGPPFLHFERRRGWADLTLSPSDPEVGRGRRAQPLPLPAPASRFGAGRRGGGAFGAAAGDSASARDRIIPVGLRRAR